MFAFKIGPVFKQYIIVSVANFISLHIGLSVSWLSPVMVILRDPDQTVLPEPLSEDQMSWILSINFLIDLLAFTFSGYLADNLGRKYSIVLACVPRIGMCILFIFTSRVWMLFLGRAICGLSESFSITIAATYASEIASKEIRGGLGTVAQIWGSIGAVTFLSIGPFVSFNTINIIHTTLIVLTTIPILLLPESPYFLYTKGRLDEAVKLLTSLRGSEELALQEIAEYSKANTTIKINKIELLKDKTVLKTIAKVMFFSLCAQMTGNTFITFHLQTIFEMTNTNVSPEISSLIIGFIVVFASCCTIYSSDRFGRKPVLTTAITAQAIGMVGLGTFFKLTQDNQEISGFLNYMPLISMILGIYSYSAGLGALIWILLAELFDGPLRAFGVSCGAFVACLGAFFTVRYTTAITHAIGVSTTYWIFAGVCIITCCFIQLFIPETKGKSFSQIQSEMRSRGVQEKGVEAPFSTVVLSEPFVIEKNFLTIKTFTQIKGRP